ncbi:sulfatase family protein [Pelagicoccus mobilis]|uniref:Sulfatase n=1 Tax=Pelagicoccus mobilis TaxID=415221 RepID=A0A934RZ47_9BACT|nr:sulfatase [Pelagicoccus mobilis]MBK1878998.1 sulfatase [Pelagicoccus mobilis]
MIRFVQILLLLGFSLPVVGLGREVLDRPNVIVIFLDDAGYGDFSHNGNPTVRTPNISWLAQEGVSFSQFYVTSPACSASRYSLLTGRYPSRSGLGSWVVGPDAGRYLHPKEITLAEGLKSAGYATGMFGKWHLGSPNAKNGISPDSLPLAHGFDRWIGTNVSHDYAVAQLLRSDPSGSVPTTGYRQLAKDLPSNPEVCEQLTKLYTDAAIEFIHEKSDEPFFAYVAYNMPHLGLYASEAFQGVSRRGLLGDVMEEVDHSIGRIVDALRDEGIERNTLIVFSSDNGPWVKFRETETLSKYGEARMHVGYAYPFRDGKGSTWEGGHRVPGIFYWPGTIPARGIDQNPASTLDVLPTVFRLCGVDTPEIRSLDGRDISASLLSEEAEGAVEPFSLIYSGPRNDEYAFRQGPWKLHVKLTSQLKTDYGFSASMETPLLFQVEQDLGERIDRAEENADVVERMLKALRDHRARIRREGSYWD